ncbi:hypothetical protein Tco_0835533, partial [Tanacetum coccineum]
GAHRKGSTERAMAGTNTEMTMEEFRTKCNTDSYWGLTNTTVNGKP